LPSTAEVPDHPPALHEATPHDLDLPSSMEVDDSQSINSEPNVDAYVAALQLECNEKATIWKILTMNQTISLITYKVSSIIFRNQNTTKN